MASQTKTAEKSATEKSATERMQDEVQGEETRMRLDLLKPAHEVRNADRLRFTARAKDLNRLLPDGEDGFDFDSLSGEELEHLAEFAEFVTSRFARNSDAEEELENLDFGVYLETVFGYVEQLGESLGSSS